MVLHLASANGHTEMANALVAAGADVDCEDNDGYGRGCVACGASFKRVCSTTVPGGRGEASGRSLARRWAWDGGAGIRLFT
jgi:ankyrin repeat protein